MKPFLTLVLSCIFLTTQPTHAQLQKVCFSPSTCCEDNIVELIHNSTESINIAIYAITNHKIYDALVEAKSRNIPIKIVTDKTQSKGKSSLVPALIDDGFNIRIKKKYRIEHNKFGIFDGKTVITGSYNWTESATRNNSENCLIEKRKTVVKKYKQRFDELWEIYGETEENTGD